MSRINEIRGLIKNDLYYLTEHADFEANQDDIDIYDIENAILNGKIRKTWPSENKYEIIGRTLDNRKIGIVGRITSSGKFRIITVYEDRPKKK